MPALSVHTCSLSRSRSLSSLSLTKEEKSYIKEAEEQKERIEQYTREGKDEWHISKQKEVLQDSLKMIPDCKKRLEAALEDLKALVVSNDNELEGGIWDNDWYRSQRFWVGSLHSGWMLKRVRVLFLEVGGSDGTQIVWFSYS